MAAGGGIGGTGQGHQTEQVGGTLARGTLARGTLARGTLACSLLACPHLTSPTEVSEQTLERSEDINVVAATVLIASGGGWGFCISITLSSRRQCSRLGGKSFSTHFWVNLGRPAKDFKVSRGEGSGGEGAGGWTRESKRSFHIELVPISLAEMTIC